MNIQNATWHRLFSQCCYKNKKLPLGQMSFLRDFTADRLGDLHPILYKSKDCAESVSDNTYQLSSGSAQRVMGQYFPYASYEVTFRTDAGSCGFAFHIPGMQVSVTCRADSLTFHALEKEETLPLAPTDGKRTMIVTCRRQNFDVYFCEDGAVRFFHSFTSDSFRDCDVQKVFQRGCVTLCAAGRVHIYAAEAYIDCGVGQADLRPVHYENGDILHENGKIYLTFSIRMQADGIQGIFSWVPGTAQLELVGALFFDCGDGRWRNYIASSLLYNRKTEQWYVWTSAFDNQLVLAYGACDGDPRFGLNVMDVTLMPLAEKHHRYEDFVGFLRDEDPDFYYDEKEKLWHLAICRLCPKQKVYRYAFFESEDPFTGYRYTGCSDDGSETGGSFVHVEGQTLFVCGNSFDKRANYRIYSPDGRKDARFDFDDGGFRGWGSVIPVKLGSRTRYFWITFDRSKGSDYTWSYGNIYCFEAME